MGPRLEENRVNAIRKHSVDKSELSSKWSALVVVQTNRQMYAVFGIDLRPRASFNVTGPA